MPEQSEKTAFSMREFKIRKFLKLLICLFEKIYFELLILLDEFKMVSDAYVST
jgi:hypothetical protein